MCQKAKRKKSEGKWTCKTWEECKGHPPLPTANNYDVFELWEDIFSCVKNSGMGPTGFDILAIKEMALLTGTEWNKDLVKRIKVLEQLFLKECTNGS